MNDRPPVRFTDRFAPPPPQAAEDDPQDEVGAFGFLRGVRDRALMLELRFKDGGAVAVTYALLDRVTYDASDGIRLYFPRWQVRIVGRSLNESHAGRMRLFDAIQRHRATFIQEASRADLMEARPGVPVVETIIVSE
jgi:hypothetical protein